MSTKHDDENGLLFIPGRWNITYNYAAGRTASRFFFALRDEEKILGTHCDQCQRTLVPPRSFCERCFRPCADWRVVGPQGSVVTFTVSYRKTPGIEREPPFMIAMIRLDKADTNLIHVVEGCDLSKPERILDQVKVGLRVTAKFRPRDKRVGHILDIDCFRVLDPAERSSGE